MADKGKGRVWIKTENKLMESTVAVASSEGFTKTTTAKIARKCGVSEGTIFAHFKTMDNLFLQTYISVDKEIADLLSQSDITNENPENNIRQLWDNCFNYALNNPQKVQFYLAFRLSPMFLSLDNMIQEGYLEKFLEYARLSRKEKSAPLIPYKIVWDYLTDATLRFAIHVYKGRITDTPASRDYIFNLLISPLIEKIK